MQVGNFAGQLSGKGAGLLVDSLGDENLDRKFKSRFDSLNGQQIALSQQRAELTDILSRKYGFTLFQAP